MKKRKMKIVGKERHYGMAQIEELYEKRLCVSTEEIRLKYIMNDKELATQINQSIAILNKQIEVAKIKGIVVELSTNFACMSDCPALQAEIYKRKNL